MRQAALSGDLFRLSTGLRFGLCGIADRLSQHLAQLRLCLCGFPLGWLPFGHTSYVGMLEAELNPNWDCPARIIHVRLARIIAIGLVDLRLQHRPHVPRLYTDHWQLGFGESAK